ncbi:MAG: AfsR family transcriptional regulator, partial [Actinomycetia bacterium]|nr:AfsR family transcriptional regulator [Actinomycetes bacterium]
LEEAPGLAARAGEAVSEAIATTNLAVVLDATGAHRRVGTLLAAAVALAARSGHPPTEVLALQHLAHYCLRAGAYDSALAHSLRAAELVPPGAVIGRVELEILRGRALAGLGRPVEAADVLSGAVRAAGAAGFAEGARRAGAELARLTADR